MNDPLTSENLPLADVPEAIPDALLMTERDNLDYIIPEQSNPDIPNASDASVPTDVDAALSHDLSPSNDVRPDVQSNHHSDAVLQGDTVFQVTFSGEGQTPNFLDPVQHTSGPDEVTNMAGPPILFASTSANNIDFLPPAPSSSCGAGEDPGDPDDGDTGTAQIGRIDASVMAEVDNPLQKSGRHTVITGHLPVDNPFSIAVKQLGVKMVSQKMIKRGKIDMPRRKAFEADLNEFLTEISSPAHKTPIIGGGPLDLFQLMCEVFKLGGVANVLKKRAFRIVAQQLELPRSCTSAAYVLKNAYNRLLYHYEQKVVFDIHPEDGSRPVDVKMLVAAEKEQERAERKRAAGVKRRQADQERRGASFVVPSMRSDPGYGSTNPVGLEQGGATTSTEMINLDEVIQGPHKRARIASDATMLSQTHEVEPAEQYMSLLTDDPVDYDLPDWAMTLVTEEHYQAFVDSAQLLDERREELSPIEVVMVAAAQCFERSSVGLSLRNALGPDLSQNRLAFHILTGYGGRPIFPAVFKLLSILRAIATSVHRPPLCFSASGSGVLIGLICTMEAYAMHVLTPIQNMAREALHRLQPVPTEPEDLHSFTRSAILASCTLYGLIHCQNALSLLTMDTRLAIAIVRVLCSAAAHDTVETMAWLLLEKIALKIDFGKYRSETLAVWIAREILQRVDISVEGGNSRRIRREERFIMAGVKVICVFSAMLDSTAEITPVLDLVAQFLTRSEDPGFHFRLADNGLVKKVKTDVRQTAFRLSKACTRSARAHGMFVSALISQVTEVTEVTHSDAALVILHRYLPLHDHAGQFLEACKGLSTTSTTTNTLQEIVKDLFISPAITASPTSDVSLQPGDLDLNSLATEDAII